MFLKQASNIFVVGVTHVYQAAESGFEKWLKIQFQNLIRTNAQTLQDK